MASATGGGHSSEVTRFLLEVSAILVAANLGGELFERLHQPPVLGELLFGIVIGNLSLVGLEMVEGFKTDPSLAVVAEIGVVLLLFQVGLESDLGELLAVGRSAVSVAVLGVIVPVALGYAVSNAFMPEEAAWYMHLFIGTTLAATSVGITARVLRDIGQVNAPEAKVILGAAVVDDILGLIVLAFVLDLVHSVDTGNAADMALLPILWIPCKAVAFLGGSILLGRLVLVPLMKLVHKAKSTTMPVVLSVAYCFAMAALAELVGLADIVGAFTAGLVVDDAITRFFREKSNQYRIKGSIQPISTIFVPVFFVYMGLRVDLLSFASRDVLVFSALLSVAAVVSKQICSLGVWEKNLNRWAVGVGMIPRGEVGLIFANIGSTVMVAGAPVFSANTFSAIVAMVMLTALATPPLLKAVFKRTPIPQGPPGD